MQYTGGKLIKKQELEEKKIFSIDKYPWPKLSQKEIISTDNSRKSVIIKNAHDDEEIKNNIDTPKSFQDKLARKNASQQIFPIDLSADFKQAQEELIRRKRRAMMDEEDAVALELAEMAMRSGQAESEWKKTKNAGERERESHGHEHSSSDNVVAERSQLSLIQEDVAATDKAAVIIKENIQIQEELETIKNQAWEESYQAGFEQGYKDAIEKNGEQLAENHENRNQNHNEDNHSLQENAKEEAISAGFISGEERGYAAGYAKLDRYFSNLAELLKEIDDLKMNILGTGQEIFMEVAKLCSEKILRKQILLDEGSLRSLFENAIRSLGDVQNIKVLIHPNDKERMKANGIDMQGASVQWLEDSSLLPGDFKVEANSQVVFVELRKAIESIVESLRLDIFPDGQDVQEREAS